MTNAKRRTFVIVWAVIIAGVVSFDAYSSVPTNVRLVDQSAPGPGEDGLSWDTAFRFLQDAIAAMNPELGVDEIWVAAGTYYPDESIQNPGGTGDTEAKFSVKANTRYYGGFAGDEEFRIERDARANITKLSGHLDVGVHSESIVAFQIGGTHRLEGFTLTEGGQPTSTGGAMVVTFSPLIVDCTFLNNHAIGGGAVSIFSATPPDNPRFINCKFIGNTAVGNGGAVLQTTGGELVLETGFVNCLFSGNSAGSNGGAIAMLTPNSVPPNIPGVNTMLLSDCTFSRNSAGDTGGGLNWSVSNGWPYTEFSARNCIFWENEDLGGIDESAQIDPLFEPNGPLVEYCCIQDLTFWNPTTNIGDDPMFCDADGADDVEGTLDDNLRRGFHFHSVAGCATARDPDGSRAAWSQRQGHWATAVRLTAVRHVQTEQGLTRG